MVGEQSLNDSVYMCAQDKIPYILRQFGIRYVRYVNYRVALVGEIAIRFLSNLAQESIASYPEFT